MNRAPRQRDGGLRGVYHRAGQRPDPVANPPYALPINAVREDERAGQQAAFAVVERWNAERSPLWSPTIRCAITAGTPWLDIYCPGCRTSRAIDIRTFDRHPLASVGSLVIGLQCSWCPGLAPMPVLTALHALPPAARWSKSMPVEFLHGRLLSAEELEMIRQQIEEG